MLFKSLVPLLFFSIASWACTTFCLKNQDHLYFAKSYDWGIGSGYLMINPTGVERKSVVTMGGTPMVWQVRYGSVTFNQYGAGFPNGGMNEAGLAIDVMWLNATRYPKPDQRPVVEDLQWVQYQLDTSKTVADVIASDQVIRMAGRVPIHFSVVDATGAMATVEFVDGNLQIHTGSQLPVPVLANHPYKKSLAYMNKTFPDLDKGAFGTGSYSRFACAAKQVKNFGDQEDPLAYAFHSLEKVRQGSYTKWQIVYDIKARTIHYQTLASPERKFIDLKSLDYSCAGQPQMVDLNIKQSGDMRPYLKDYDPLINREQVYASFRGFRLEGFSDYIIEMVARWPQKAACH